MLKSQQRKANITQNSSKNNVDNLIFSNFSTQTHNINLIIGVDYEETSYNICHHYGMADSKC